MRGSPIFRLVLVFAGLLLAGIPVWQLTHRGKNLPVRVPAVAASDSETGHWMEVEMTASAPARLALSSLGQSLLHSDTSVPALGGRIFVSGKSPDDLVVSAKWENSTANHAVRVVVKENGETLKDATFWGTDSVEDVLP